jgi:hypothetical protein
VRSSSSVHYGNTKQCAYMCEADAKAAGDRAAKNESTREATYPLASPTPGGL